MRCLWLSKTIPFPQTAGDRVYSAKLAAALAAAGVEVTFAGLPGDAPPTSVPGVHWHTVDGRKRNRFASLVSTLPLSAARHATPSYAAEISSLARSRAWDAVVVDNYGMGWAMRHRGEFPGIPFVFIAHDHEESVTHLQYRDPTAPLPLRLYMAQNYWKTRALERRTASGCDLITTISRSDADLFETTAPGIPRIVLVPGYDGPRLSSRLIGADTPRAVVLFGSYRWSAKQTNLKMFLEIADPAMLAAGIEVRVVGDIADDFRQAMEQRYRCVRFTGFVADPTPHMVARLAVCAEPIGGGFKMKLLEYVFRRLPVVALTACAAGLPRPVLAETLLYPDLQTLLDGIIGAIDDMPRLNRLQDRAFAAAESAFDWAERGQALLAAIVDIAGVRMTEAARAA